MTHPLATPTYDLELGYVDSPSAAFSQLYIRDRDQNQYGEPLESEQAVIDDVLRVRDERNTASSFTSWFAHFRLGVYDGDSFTGIIYINADQLAAYGFGEVADALAAA